MRVQFEAAPLLAPLDGLVSRQMKTCPSYEDEARIVPYFGCAWGEGR